MTDFVVYPAIDLRKGQVVRLSQGDLDRQTHYHDDPASVAARWRAAGAAWIHVINLDGAFDQHGVENLAALPGILESGVRVQLGGGLRSIKDIEIALEMGIARAILGTVAADDPEFVGEAVAEFGAGCVAVGIDTLDGSVRVRGWTEDAGIDPIELSHQLSRHGLSTLIVTDISRDGVGTGLNLELCRQINTQTGLEVIASGGVATLEDVRQARDSGAKGVIIGRALYEGNFTLEQALAC